MLKNYFIVAWRNLWRSRTFSFINISGLSIGMAVCLLILQYVFFESGFDDFHRNGKDIYRINYQRYLSGKLVEKSAMSFSGIAPAMKADFPEVKAATNFFTVDCILSTNGAGAPVMTFKEHNVFFVDEHFMEIFTFPMLSGSASALTEPNNIILTEKTARKYFGEENPIGKSLKVENHNQGTNITVTVSGICKDVPTNSNLRFDCLISTRKVPGTWDFPDTYNYVQLNPGTNIDRLEAKLPGFLMAHATKRQDNSASSKIELTTIPLRKIHLYSDYTGEQSPGGNGKFVWFLSLIAIVVLLIAYINYVNLSTIKAIERAKEVGLRKVFGSMRWALIKQFTFESLFINIIGVILAIAITLLCHGLFNQLTGEDLSFAFWKDVWLWLAIFGFTILGALLSGLYPASLLSSYRPIQVLKGKIPISRSGIGIRQVLVIFQFAISIVLIIGTFVIYSQVNYMRQNNLGMNISQTLIVAAPSVDLETQGNQQAFYQRITTFQKEMISNPGVTGITSASSIPGLELSWTRPYRRRVEDIGKGDNLYSTFSIGPEFLDQFGIKTVAGQKFALDRPAVLSDTGKSRGRIPVMINEAAASALGFTDVKSAVGQILVDRNGMGMTFEYEIIGVSQNFHQKSLKEAYLPIVFRLEDGSSIEYYAVKFKTQDVQKTVARIQDTYRSLFPSSPFEYFFLDEFFNNQYKQDVKFGKIFGIFSSLAIFIGCLGLLGLSMFTNMQRTKEIGIRKVLGASNGSILALLFKDFAKLILISSLIAWPLSYLGVYYWLQGYAFRINIHILLFIIPTLIVLLVAFITVGWRTWKVGSVTPVRALRNE